MSYPKRLLRFSPTQGVVFDAPASELTPQVYSSVQNVQFRDVFASKVGGTRDVYGSVNEAYALEALEIEGIIHWVYFGVDDIGTVQSSVHNDITPVGGLTPVNGPFQWSTDTLNNVLVANNTFDAPLFWSGEPANPMEPLPGWPAGTTCAFLAAHRFHLFAFNTDEPGGQFPSKVVWSDAAEPGTIPDSWTPAPDNEAGDFELSDSKGGIVAALTLGDTLLAYKTSSTYAINYVGGNSIYQRRKLFGRVGLLNPRSVIDINQRHAIITDNDIIIHDGSNVQSIAEQRTRRFLFQQLDQTNFRNAFITYHRAAQEIWVCIPESGNTFATLALTYSIPHNAWGTRELFPTASATLGVVDDMAGDDSWDSDSQSWDDDTTIWNETNVQLAQASLVLGHPETMTLEKIDEPGSASSRLALVERADLTFNEPERVKFVRRVHVRARDGFTRMRVRIGAKMALNNPVDWSQTVLIDEPAQIIDSFAQGRYISLQAESVDDHPFEPVAFDIEAELRGYF